MENSLERWLDTVADWIVKQSKRFYEGAKIIATILGIVVAIVVFCAIVYALAASSLTGFGLVVIAVIIFVCVVIGAYIEPD